MCSVMVFGKKIQLRRKYRFIVCHRSFFPNLFNISTGHGACIQRGSVSVSCCVEIKASVPLLSTLFSDLFALLSHTSGYVIRSRHFNHYFPDPFVVVWFNVSECVHLQLFIAAHRHTTLFFLVCATSLLPRDVTSWGSLPKPDPVLPQRTSK